jgi:hypothetical protein
MLAGCHANGSRLHVGCHFRLTASSYDRGWWPLAWRQRECEPRDRSPLSTEQRTGRGRAVGRASPLPVKASVRDRPGSRSQRTVAVAQSPEGLLGSVLKSGVETLEGHHLAAGRSASALPAPSTAITTGVAQALVDGFVRQPRRFATVVPAGPARSRIRREAGARMLSNQCPPQVARRSVWTALDPAAPSQVV